MESSRIRQLLNLLVCAQLLLKGEGYFIPKTLVENAVSKGADFYNWNRVKVRYCDGSSFTGDVEEVNSVSFAEFKGIGN
ncbi:hypothetical protein Fmac_015141 [Flemingia macrophylla]|uniref:Pectin acetylesterase n=1 Tax=Flemingia macrophylla TaxID=520843 RepID=A0ABD1MDQ5_9FABA